VPALPATAPGDEPLSFAVTSLLHPSLDVVTSPVKGEIVGALLSKGRQVRKGDKLFEIAHKLPPNAKEKAAAKRVAELEKLAESDPVYKPFLEKAQHELRGRQGRTQTVLVKAASAGTMQPLAGPGDQVDADQPLAARVDTAVWLANAIVTGSRPKPSWSCAITSADGEKRAECIIDRVTETGDGIQVAARIDAGKAAWLRGQETDLRLVLEPAGAP
jgi:biotin carboxyl carrier protein